MFYAKSALIVVIQFACVMISCGQGSFLTGRIVDKNHLPLEGIVVHLGRYKPVFTKKDGSFSFQHLEKGHYHLTLSYSGVPDLGIPVDIIKDTTVLDAIIMDFSIRELDEIIVNDIHSGEKPDETLQTEVINSHFIRRHMDGSLMQSLERLPGIKSIHIGSSGSKPLIRGLGFNQVVVVENGIKHEGQQWGADHGLEIDQYRINKMEIIRGPSSFIYGSDALAGAIDIKPLPKPAPNSVGGSVDLTGRTNNRQYGGSFNFYGRKNKWFFDSRISYINYGDYRVPADTVYSYSYAVRLHKNFVRNTAGRELNTFVSSGYITGKFSSVFSVSNNATKSGFFANAHGLEPRNVNEKLHDASSRDINLPYQQVSHTKIINHTTLNAGAHRLEINAGFQRNFRREFSQYVNHGYMPPVYPPGLIYPPHLERQYDKQVWSLNAKDELHSGKHSIVYGFNSELQQNAIGGWGFLIPAFSQKSAGIFFVDKYFLSDKMMLQGALRYDYGNIRVKEYGDWFETEMEKDGETTREKLKRASAFNKSFNNFTWSAGMNYKPGKLTLTANIGSGFRMPIAKELAANGVNYHYFRYEKGNAFLSPEKSYQLDAGISWKEKQFHIRLSPFLNYFSNYIYLNPSADYDMYYGAGNQVFNYSQTRLFRAGAELQAGYQFLKYWHVEVAGEYVFNRQLSGTKKGYSLPFTPPPSGLFTLSWEAGWQNKWMVNNYISIDYRIAAPQNNIVPPEKKTPGYSVLGIAAGSRIKTGKDNIYISLQVKNVLNKEYLSHTSFYRLIELPEMGRNIILSVKIPFTAKHG